MKQAIQETFAKRIVNWSSSDFIVDVFNFGKYAWGNVLHVNWGNVLQCNTLPRLIHAMFITHLLAISYRKLLTSYKYKVVTSLLV